MSKDINSLDTYLKKPVENYLKCKTFTDHINIGEIAELTKKCEEANENGDLVSQIFYLKNIFSKMEDLSSEMKSEVNEVVFMLIFQIVSLLFNNYQFQEVIDCLEEAKNRLDYGNIETIKKCFFNKYLSCSKLFLGLNNESKSSIFEAKELNEKLIENAGKITSGELKKSVLDDKKIIDAWENDTIKTVIEFEIPFPLIVRDEPLEFEYEGTKHIIEIELIESPLSPIPTSGGAYAEIVEDKYGLATRSNIKLTLFKYINPHEIVELNILAQDRRVSRALLEAIKVMNFFIERYKLTTNNYWLENIFHKMISDYKCTVTAGNFKIHSVMTLKSQLMKLTFGESEIPWLSPEELGKLRDNLEKDRLGLWNSLLLDAKDYLLRRNYREAIYAINGAFENFLMLKAREILSKDWGNENAEEYLDGIPNYNYHNLSGYMNEESFNKAIEDKKIGKVIPPTGQILKEVYNVHKLPISRTKLDKLVKKIRKNRNEVMHGVNLNEDLEIITFEAIKSFEDFIKLFD